MRSVMSKTCAVQNTGFIDLFCETLIWSSWNMKAENQILPGSGDQMGHFLRVPSKRLTAPRTWKKKQVDPTAALNNFVRWGEPRWTRSRSGKVKIQGMVSPLASFFSSPSSWPLFSGSLQGTGHAGKATDVHLSSQGTERAEALSHFFAICCKFKAARDKAFFMGERKRKDYLWSYLLIPRKWTLQGAEGKGTEAGGGTKFVTKISPSPSRKFLSQPLPEDITGIFFFKRSMVATSVWLCMSLHWDSF